MRELFLKLLLVFSLSSLSVAQKIAVTGQKIELPDGDIIGAAFDEDTGRFLVQQNVISTEKAGLVFRSHRRLTSWEPEQSFRDREKGV